MRSGLLSVAVMSLILASCNKISPVGKASLENDDDKTIYSIGVDMGTKLKTLQLTKKELAVLKMGIDDGVEGKDPQVDMKSFITKVGPLLRARSEKFSAKEKKASEDFLTKASKESGAQKTESGLVYVQKTEGKGASPKAEDRVKVHYHGTLRDGTVFDSSKDKGQPAEFRLDRVIKCWTEAVQKMKVGGKSDIYCPSAIAYGDRGAPPKIPPGAALKFEVELLDIVTGKEAPKNPHAGGAHDKMKKAAKNLKDMAKDKMKDAGKAAAAKVNDAKAAAAGAAKSAAEKAVKAVEKK